MNYKNYSMLDSDNTLLGDNINSYSIGQGFHPVLLRNRNGKNGLTQGNMALKGIQEKSELSELFFSGRNMKRLQKMIKKDVYEKTNKKYKLDTDQEDRDLYIFMRAVYMEYGTFDEGQIIRQVKRLNRKVIQEIVPGIITNLKQYYGYLEEINKPITPIDRPLNVSSAGRKTLPSITTIFHI